MHLLLDKVGSAVMESAPGRGNYTSHLIRMRDATGEPHVTFYLMWPESAPRGARQMAAGQSAAHPQGRAVRRGPGGGLRGAQGGLGLRGVVQGVTTKESPKAALE